MTHKDKVAFIEKSHPALSLARQANLLSISRSSIYYVPVVPLEDIRTMHAIDEVYTKRPFYGSRRIKDVLVDNYQIHICREHVQRLMRVLGLEAIYPKRRLSVSAPGHQIYPYLLRNLPILRSNQVWGTDITYVRLQQGFCYLTAILDWYSRYVVSWELSETMEQEFCLTALRSALGRATTEIHNSDQGSQYTSEDYTAILNARGVAISMDGRGRCMDNIFTERLWRTVKYEDIYLKGYRTIDEVREGLTRYFPFYNEERRHQGLKGKRPAEVYFGRA